MLKDNDIVIGKPYKNSLNGRIGVIKESLISQSAEPVYMIQWTDGILEAFKKYDFIQTFVKVTKEEYDIVYNF